MDMEIFIVGQNFLANELLSCFLAEQLPECRVSRLEQIPDFHHSVNLSAVRQTLLLCDCQSYAPDYFLGNLKSFALQRSCQTRCLLYNLEHDLELEIELLKSGVQGLVFADDPPETLVKAITNVSNGQLWASRQALSSCLRNSSTGATNYSETLLKKLTPRECQILRLIVNGSSNETIAEYLCISRHTVKTHIYNIYRKINVSNRLKAAKWAEQHLPAS